MQGVDCAGVGCICTTDTWSLLVFVCMFLEGIVFWIDWFLMKGAPKGQPQLLGCPYLDKGPYCSHLTCWLGYRLVTHPTHPGCPSQGKPLTMPEGVDRSPMGFSSSPIHILYLPPFPCPRRSIRLSKGHNLGRPFRLPGGKINGPRHKKGVATSKQLFGYFGFFKVISQVSLSH